METLQTFSTALALLILGFGLGILILGEPQLLVVTFAVLMPVPILGLVVSSIWQSRR